MSKMILIGLVASLLTADSRADLSAVDIADKMIAANTRTAFNLEGRFLCVTRDRLRDGGQATIALYEKTLNDSTQSSHREQVARRLEALKEDYRDGFAEQSLEFSGIYVSPTRFSLFRKELDLPEQPLILFKANDEKSMQYYEEGQHVVIDRCDVKNGLVRDRKNELGLLEKWMGPVNDIRTNEKVQITGRTTYRGDEAVILKQEPTAWSLGEFSITHTVLPAKGYVAVRSEYRDKETGTLVRLVECSNVVEIQPGVWRPLEMTETRYALSSYDLPEYQELEVDTVKKLTFAEIPKANADLPADTFHVVVPPGTTKVVDKTLDKPLVLEHDPCDMGAAYIEAVLENRGQAAPRPLNDQQTQRTHTTRDEGNRSEAGAHPDAMEETGTKAIGITILMAVVCAVATGLLWMKYRGGHDSHPA